MSQLQLVQIGSNGFKPKPLFSTLQELGNTTNFESYPSGLAVPVGIAGSTADSKNPVGIIDNRYNRNIYLLLMLAATAANNANLAFDVTGFSAITTAASTYLRTRLFNGIAQAGNIDASALGVASTFLCDNFPTKTFAPSSGIWYVEPADDSSAALMILDIRGFDYVMVRLAQGGSTAATKGQVFYGVN